MKQLFRKTAASDANFWERLFAKYTKYVTRSEYCHGGVSIRDGYVWHVTWRNGFHEAPYTPENWEVYDRGQERDAEIAELVKKLEGTKYDPFSLLSFTFVKFAVSLAHKVPWLSRHLKSRLYCYEWQYYAEFGEPPTKRVTAETLLAAMLQRPVGK